MFIDIDIAIIELDAINMEIASIVYELEHPEPDFPLSEICRKSMLVRLAVLDNGYKFLERHIIHDLSKISLDHFFTPKATENE